MIVTTEEAIAMFFASLIILGFIFAFLFMVFLKISAKKSQLDASRAKKKKARDKARADLRRNYIDYFWSDKDRFTWISMFLIFFIFLGLSIHTYISIMFSIGVAALTVYFLYFSYDSYKKFPIKAKAELDKFESTIMKAVEKEVSFNGDNIQVFANDDDEFDTKPKIFKFPTNVTKIPFPPFQMIAKKQEIIATRKFEFLVLSREYFSIGKSASMFNLLKPTPPKAGVFDEYYYSQMRNVKYDAKTESINIIYRDHEDDVSFPCKKKSKDLAPAMTALKEKLRLNERQRMRKIEEHKYYEDIKEKRKKSKEEIKSD